MKWHFTFDEFVTLEGNEFPVNADITDKIVKHHMLPLQRLRKEIQKPIYIRSCYRPGWFEREKGRDYISQHQFKGLGACDISLTKFGSRKAEGWKDLFRLLKYTDYRRLSWYPNGQFFHADYKANERQLFVARNRWEYVTEQELERILPD